MHGSSHRGADLDSKIITESSFYLKSDKPEEVHPDSAPYLGNLRLHSSLTHLIKWVVLTITDRWDTLKDPATSKLPGGSNRGGIIIFIYRDE